MSIRKAFLHEDMLRRRKRLGWLGWVTVMVTASFLLALGGLAWHFKTAQVIPLSTVTPEGASAIISDEVTVEHTTAQNLNLVTSPDGAPSVPPKAWAVWKAKDATGQEIWDSAPEIKAWVIKDYLDALNWTDEQMYQPDYLLQHLADYYTDKRLDEMRDVVAWEIKNQRAFVLSSVLRLPLGTIVGTFSVDGKQATLLDYDAAGRGQLIDLKTHKPIQGDAYPNTMHMVEMRYDENSQRWKIAHAKMDYDLDDGKIIWQEEWDSVQ